MAQGKISSKQKEILEYIKSQILERGFPPSVRDICEAVHLKSTSSVHSHLETLEKNGYIRRDPTKPRAIEILDDSFNFMRREMVNVPIVGRVAAGEPILAGAKDGTERRNDCRFNRRWCYCEDLLQRRRRNSSAARERHYGSYHRSRLPDFRKSNRRIPIYVRQLIRL